jgi:hypothetical protein
MCSGRLAGSHLESIVGLTDRRALMFNDGGLSVADYSA